MNATAARGLFDPDGVFWRVNRESVLLLGGGAALLMQVAHPGVAAAVADHSDYRNHPLRRLVGTVTAIQDIVFGDRDLALDTARRINGIHERVNGTLAHGTSRYPPGTRYSAKDPELLLWVYATLVVMALRTYTELIAPLSAAEQAFFYDESRTIAKLFGVPDDGVPASLAEFRQWYEGIVGDDVLEITPEARRIADDILHPPIFGFPRRLGVVTGMPTLALLPDEIRRKYGYEIGQTRGRVWRIFSRGIRRTLPLTPAALRVNHRARRAES